MKKGSKAEKQESGQAGDEVRKVFTVRLPVWLHKAFKIKAAQEGRKMQDVALKMFTEYVGGKPAGMRPKAKKP